MIFGIGTDLVDLTRVARIYQKYGNRLARKLLDEEDFKNIKETLSSKHLATQFAVKEATVKALGTGFQYGIYPSSIHLEQDLSGKPSIRVSERAAEVFEENGIRNTFLSISHDKDLVVEFVVLEN